MHPLPFILPDHFFQTVIKPLGKVFGSSRGLGGFTILGDGTVALILDVPGLLGQLAQGASTARPILAARSDA